MSRCEICGYESDGRAGVEIHKTMKHKRDFSEHNNPQFEPVENRFWDYVNKTDNYKDCWYWNGRTDNDGYGRITVKGKEEQAHRVILRDLIGINLYDYNVLHKCDNPSCVNPHHLYLGTQSQNIKDSYQRNNRTQRGDRNGRSILDTEQVIEIYIKSKIGNESLNEISDDFDVSRQTVSSIKRNKNWKTLTEKFDFILDYIDQLESDLDDVKEERDELKHKLDSVKHVIGDE